MSKALSEQELKREYAVYVCKHCGLRYIKGQYCDDCSTANKRKAVCEENNKIRKEAKLEPLKCWCGA